MAPKRKSARAAAAEWDPDGIFHGVSAFLVPYGVQSRRLEVWKQRLVQVWKQRQVQVGACVQEKVDKGAPAVNHVLAMDAKALLRELDAAWLHRFRGSVVSFEWLEECLKAGERLPEHKFAINYEEEFKPKKVIDTSSSGVLQPAKRSKMLSEDTGNQQRTGGDDREELAGAGHQDASANVNEGSGVEKKPNQYADSQKQLRRYCRLSRYICH